MTQEKIPFFDQLREQLVEGKFKEILLQLKTIVKSSPKLNALEQLKARLFRLETDIDRGTLTDEQERVEYNRITARLLETITAIEEKRALPEWQEEIDQSLIKVQDAKNALINSTIEAKEVHIGDKIIYNNQVAIPHHLTQQPFYPKGFIGREDELDAIYYHLFSEEVDNLMLLVNGHGGIGKTSIAAFYYYRYHRHYAHVAWVLSEKSIANAMLNMAYAMGLQFDERMGQEQRLQVLLQAMANLKDPCLLIIDNANELEDLEANYDTLRRCPNFHLLITSRINYFRGEPVFRIKGLEEKEKK